MKNYEYKGFIQQSYYLRLKEILKEYGIVFVDRLQDKFTFICKGCGKKTTYNISYCRRCKIDKQKFLCLDCINKSGIKAIKRQLQIRLTKYKRGKVKVKNCFERIVRKINWSETLKNRNIKIAIGNRGKMISDETKQKISIATKKLWEQGVYKHRLLYDYKYNSISDWLLGKGQIIRGNYGI
jgi:hypothetical protein